MRHGFGLTSAPTSLISQVISPAKQDTLDWSVSLWTYPTQGWHPVTGASVPVSPSAATIPAAAARGQDNVLFEVLTVRPEVVVGVERPFIVRAMTFVTNIFPFQRPENLGEMTYAYAAKGVLVLPPFDAGARVYRRTRAASPSTAGTSATAPN